MSGKLLQAVWDYKGKDLNCSQKHALARMAWYASDAGGDIFPSVNKLAEQINCSRSLAFEILNHLKEFGFIAPEGISGRKTIRYRISLSKLGIDQEFNDFSSQVPVDKSQSKKLTRPESGLLPVQNLDSTRPESGPNKLSNHYVEKHNNDFKKEQPKRSIKAREQKLDFEQGILYGKLIGFRGMSKRVALSIVEDHTLGTINNVLELATKDNVRNPGGYVVKSLYPLKEQNNG